MPSSKLIAPLVAAGLFGLLAAPAMADTAPASSPHSDCFFANQFGNWVAPSPDVIYLRVNVNDIYRLDLAAGGSSELQDPDAHLVTVFRGGDTVCSPLDLDLSVAVDHARVPVIVKAMTKLSAAEVAALPRKDRP